MPSPAISAKLKPAAAAVTGTLIKNENRAASSRLKPKNSPHVIVAPERETPTLTISIYNEGRVSAHNVRGWLSLDGEYFGPLKPYRSPHGMPLLSPDVISKKSWGHIFSEDAEPNEFGYYPAQVYETGALLVHSRREFNISLTLRRSGNTAVHCRVVCNEGNVVEGWMEVEIPEPATGK